MTIPDRSPSPDTEFAPGGRDSAEKFSQKVRTIGAIPFLRLLLDAMPGMVMILNSHRQIVAANEAIARTLNSATEDLLEKRPGEALGCIRSQAGADGCGTDRHCAACGAVNAILESQEKGVQVVRECRLLIEEPSGVAPLDLKVTATPMMIDGEQFIIAAVEDISQPKRLAVLQRVFFHDVLNTAGCISGYAYCLWKRPQTDEEDYQRLTQMTNQLVEEIRAQQDLLTAESGDLQVQTESVATQPLLEALKSQYLKTPWADQRGIALHNTWIGEVPTDRRLLLRVLGNMLKNALEAAPQGQTVTMSCLDQGEQVAFAVHNPGAMPESVQLQVFQRSFSTKGHPGRGIGTYSMKLFGERYLGGRVEFISREPEGTTFTLTIPKGHS